VPEPLAFEVEMQRRTTSWERADPSAALLERQAWDEWLVTLLGGEPHTVRLRRENGVLIGECDCKGWQYRDHDESPCAHLCTVRKAAFGHVDDMIGQRVRILDADEERAQNIDRVRADGGRRYDR
jgi:hypothetical protein